MSSAPQLYKYGVVLESEQEKVMAPEWQSTLMEEIYT